MKAIILLKVAPGKTGEVYNALKQLKVILESCIPFGRFDAAIVVQAGSLEEIWGIIISQVNPIAGVIGTFPCLIEADKSLENPPEHVKEFIAIGG